MSNRWRTAVLVAAAAAVAMGTPAASAASPSDVVATWHVPAGFYELQAGLGSMWAANVDEYHDATLYRIDPATDSLDRVASLGFPGGGMIVAYGSVWITDYFGNAVWRLAPDGSVQAAISVGLQPQWLTAAFGSVWTSNHHGGSLSRIDPGTNTVVATVPVGKQHTFRDGPQALTHDATRLYAGSSNLLELQAVDPADDTVSTPAVRAGDDQFCGELRVAGGFVWSLDACSGALYQLGKDGTVQTVISGGSSVQLSETVLDGSLWVSEDEDPDNSSDADLLQRDPRTGTELRVALIGGDAATVRAGFDDLWVFDSVRHTIRRIDV